MQTGILYITIQKKLCVFCVCVCVCCCYFVLFCFVLFQYNYGIKEKPDTDTLIQQPPLTPGPRLLLHAITNTAKL